MMIGFQEKGGVLYADDIPLPALAQQYGTPLYIYSARQIQNNIDKLRRAFAQILPQDDQPLIAFACKANSNIAVLKLMQKQGLGCDVVSGGELQRAQAAGIAPDKIVYSGVGKTDAELAQALHADILQINVESRAELENLAALAQAENKTARVAFRFNPDVDAGTHEKISTGRNEDKFGLPGDEIEELYQWAAAHAHLRPQGLQVHIGSQISHMAPFQQAFEKLAALTTLLQSRDLPVEYLDLGGGLGITYKDEPAPDLNAYAEIIRDFILPLGARIILEPGRFLVGDAGLLLAKVSYIKTGKTRRFIILDAGMNDLIRPTLYEAYHPVLPIEKREGSAKMTYDIVGPVCETGDTFLKAQSLPAVQQDDLMALMMSGAYGFGMASNYNTRPLPAEILVDGDKHAIIRQKQTVHDILEKEQIPGWLSA